MILDDHFWSTEEEMDVHEVLYVGIKAQVLAIERRTGKEVWRTALPRGSFSLDDFVQVFFDSGSIFAQTGGRLFCLDAETGRIQWQNNLDACGHGIATLASASSSTDNLALVHRRRQIQAAPFTATSVIATTSVIAGQVIKVIGA
jgi:hypothetical protein